jgi:hypothetical protein
VRRRGDQDAASTETSRPSTRGARISAGAAPFSPVVADVGADADVERRGLRMIVGGVTEGGLPAGAR